MSCESWDFSVWLGRQALCECQAVSTSILLGVLSRASGVFLTCMCWSAKDWTGTSLCRFLGFYVQFFPSQSSPANSRCLGLPGLSAPIFSTQGASWALPEFPFLCRSLETISRQKLGNPGGSLHFFPHVSVIMTDVQCLANDYFL